MSMSIRQHPKSERAHERPLRSVARAAATFPSISLEELGAATLLDRLDTKFVLPARALPVLLERLAGQYRALEVDERRLARYNTRYFDTPDLKLYHDHHAGRAPRQKVRIRSYVDSESRFLEVKLRTNKGRTLKARRSLALDGLHPMERLEREQFLGFASSVSAQELTESLAVDYTRLTLVRNDTPERITLDLMLSFTRRGSVAYPGAVVAELKQDRRRESPFIDALKQLRVRGGGLSKYCIGIAVLEPGIRRSRFKEALRRLERTGAETPLTLHAEPFDR